MNNYGPPRPDSTTYDQKYDIFFSFIFLAVLYYITGVLCQSKIAPFWYSEVQNFSSLKSFTKFIQYGNVTIIKYIGHRFCGGTQDRF